MTDSRAYYRRRRAVAAGGLVVLAVLLAIGVSSLGGGAGRGPAGATATTAPGRHPASNSATRSTGAPVTPAPRRPPMATSYAIGTTQLTILEPSSSAEADARLPSGAPARALSTQVRYPVAPRGTTSGGPFPLVVFSQGFDYPAEAYSALMDAWTRAGYIVAEPIFPHTDPAASDGIDESDILNHPADLRFVIATLLRTARTDPNSPLRKILNPSEVAVAGQSDGGDVSLAVAANSCCQDRAVKAAVILSGAELPAFGGRYYSAGTPPLLVVQGDADTINSPGCSAALYDAAPAPKYYLDLLGADHLQPYVYPTAWRGRVERSVIAFLDRYLKHEPGGLDRLARAAADPGVASLITTPTLPGRSTYCPPAGIS